MKFLKYFVIGCMLFATLGVIVMSAIANGKETKPETDTETDGEENSSGEVSYTPPVGQRVNGKDSIIKPGKAAAETGSDAGAGSTS